MVLKRSKCCWTVLRRSKCDIETMVQVAEKERAQRLLEIYNRMDARSHVVHEGKKFKKSDILQVTNC